MSLPGAIYELKIHQNVFADRALPDPTGFAIDKRMPKIRVRVSVSCLYSQHET